MSPGINLPPQQPVIESELLLSLSGLSHDQKGCYFSSILSSRDVRCLAEMVQSTSSPTEFALALDFDLFTAHSMKTTKPKGGQGNNIAVPFFLLSTFLHPSSVYSMTASKMLSSSLQPHCLMKTFPY